MVERKAGNSVAMMEVVFFGNEPPKKRTSTA